MGYHSPVTKGRSPTAPQFLGFSLILYLWLYSFKKNDQSGRGKIYGERVVSRRSVTHSTPRRRGPIDPQLCGFFAIYAYLEQPNSAGYRNTYGEVHFMRLAMPLHLHKCVARFVSFYPYTHLYA